MQTNGLECLQSLKDQQFYLEQETKKLLHLGEQWLANSQLISPAQWSVQMIDHISKIHAYFKKEEDLLIPVLNEMYGHDDKISIYIREEHQLILFQFECLTSFGIPSNNQPCDLLENMQLPFQNLSVHLYQEQQALFPLVNRYLRSLAAN